MPDDFDYSNPPYPRALPGPKGFVTGPVDAYVYNALVREYNELVEDIDMILRAMDAVRNLQEKS